MKRTLTRLLLALTGMAILLSLSACGGGGGGNTTPATKTATATPTLKFVAAKTFRFTWKDVSGATYYKLMENPDGISGFTQVGRNIPQGTQTIDRIVPLYARLNAQYILESCNATDCTDSSAVSVSGTLVASIGYIKASNTGADDEFGYAVSLSADGSTLAVGAMQEGSNATGINPAGGQNNNSATYSGAVYVFTRSGSNWQQQAYIKASNTGKFDFFGRAVSLSEDGNTLAVGAWGESSDAKGITPTSGQNNTSRPDSGAVYVFTRNAATWSQQDYIKASNPAADDYFGYSVSLSTDGNTLAVGAYQKDIASTVYSGVVYVFTRISATWSQQTYVKASTPGNDDRFGWAVSLSGDGNILAVGATGEDSSANIINGNPNNDQALYSGAVYVFIRSGTSWSQQAYIKASNTGAHDKFGYAVSLSKDGKTLAVGARYEDSNATGTGGDQNNNKAPDSGAVYIFTHSRKSWSQQTYLKASNTGANDHFGDAVSLSADGNTLAVGATGEESTTRGIGGDQTNNSTLNSGAVYVFTRSTAAWSQLAYVKASNTDANDHFGDAASLSGDGNTLVVGAWSEDSNATGTGGDQNNNKAPDSGAVYLY